MKQILMLIPFCLAGFTFVATLLLALLRSSTFMTALTRSLFSAVVILVIALGILFLIKVKVIDEAEESYRRNARKQTSSSNEGSSNEFQPGYEHILSNSTGSQIDKDITWLLENDPARATELLKKMSS